MTRCDFFVAVCVFWCYSHSVPFNLWAFHCGNRPLLNGDLNRGENKSQRKKEKELRKWVKEQQEKRCQYVISPGDWTKIEGRVPFFLGLSHLVPVHLQCVGACVCVYCIRLWSVLCHFSVLTFIYTSNMLKFSYRRDFSMCIQMWGCRRLCVCGCIHACLYVGVFSSLHLVRWWFTGLRD